MRVAKWGNSLAIRLPKALVEKLDLKEGDEVNVKPSGKGTIGIVRLGESRQAHLENLRRLRGMIPAGFKFDRDEANER